MNRNDLPANDAGNKQHGIKLKRIGTKCNRTAIGARGRVATGDHVQRDEVLAGSSVMSQGDLRLHLGLGKAQTVDFIAAKDHTQVKANQIITTREDNGIVAEAMAK